VTGTYTVGGSATSFSASGSDLANNSVGRTLTLSGGTLKLAGPSGPSAGASNFSAYGTTVNGYEDSFEGSSLGANWNLSSGLSASVSGGKLTLTPTGSWSYTKSSLLYTLGTTTTPQTVLAKVKFNTVGTGDASGRAGVTAATAVDGNGIRFLARNGGSGGNNNLNFLNEAVAWGTVSANNIWSSSKDYWMQLTYDPATGNSTGKLWLADGVATEPTSAVQTTDRYYGTWSSSTLRTGYSGLSIGSGDNMTVDYILIQNSGLPSISNVGVGIVPVNLSNTHIAATASSELDLFASSANHILGDLTLANATLTIKNVNTVEFGNINASGTAALAYDTANGIKLRGTIGTATVTVDSGGTLTLDGAKTTVTAATALAKAGAGTLTMTGTHGYTVATQVNGGTLKLDGAGSINSSSGITVNGSGAKFITTSSAAVTTPITMTQGTIGGTGTISASGGVSIGTNAIQAPGVSPGTQNYSTGLTWAGGGTLQFEINDAGGTAGTDWDLLTGSTLNITATSDSKFTIDITSLSGSSPGNAANFSSSGSYKWKIADFDNAIVVWDAGVFTLLRTHFSNSNTGTWAIKRGDETGVGGDSTELWLTYDPPPPGTYWAPASGGGGDGTWTSSATVWATDAGVQGVGPQATGKLTFGNTVGAVTVNNTVTADAGMDINTTGYTFVAGTGTPKISLTGIDTFANTITVGSSVTATISIALDGTAGMTKAGTGTLVLGATSTYTGATTVNVGTLLVNGMLDTAANAVTVSGTGTLGGTGTIKRSVDVQSGATLAPGTEGTVGELAVTGNVTFQSGSTFKVDGNGATADKLTVTGPVTLNGATLNVSGTPTGTEYEIVLVQGDGNILNGTFSNSTVTWGGKTYKVTYTTTQVKLVLAPGGTVIMFK
jgi:autotransporter-associated beta strand protein